MHRSLRLCIALPTLLLSTGISAQSADIKVTPVAVNESRYKVLIPTKRKSYYNNTLTVTLRFEGEDIAKSTRYGMLTVTSGKDDSGAEIKLSRTFNISSKRLQTMSRNSTNVIGEKMPPTQYELPVRLELPNRSAKSIESLKGTVTFAMGKTESVTIPVSKLQDLVGKKIEHPLLAKLGLTAELEKYMKTSGHRARFKITGKKREAVLAVKYVDPAGKDKSFGSYVFRSFNYTSANANSSSKLPEGSTLQIVLETERNDVVVPFELTNIPLN